MAYVIFLVVSYLVAVSGFLCSAPCAVGGHSKSMSNPSFSRSPCSPLKMTLPEGISGTEKLEKLFKDSELLGPVRFVSMTDGAILETVGSWDNLRFNDLPKGRYATVSDTENTFEAHIKMDNVAGVKMLTMPTKDGKRTLYVTRMLDKKGDTIMSAMLHAGKEGDYEEGAVEYWEKLRDVFGEEWNVR